MASPTPSAKRQAGNYTKTSFKSEFKDFITVLVGADEKRFVVHQDLVSKSSTYFKSASSSKWIEGREKILRLPEEDSDIFKVYLDWLYGQKDLKALGHTVFDKLKDRSEKIEETEIEKHVVDFLCRAWIFGDYVGDVKFENEVLNSLHEAEQADYQSYISTFRNVFNKTRVDSSLQRFMMDWTIHFINPDWFEEHGKTIGKKWRDALTKKMVGLIGSAKGEVRSTLEDVSNYYEANE